jgi:F-type H+-transporting ATPase subunit b
MDTKVILAAVPEILTQLAAFLIVFFILKKFAFGTIFKALEARQKTIADSIHEAEKKKTELEALKKEYELKLQGIEQEGRLKIQAAIADGQRIAAEIKEKSQQDAGVLVERAKQEIRTETEKARAMMRQQVVELSAQMAGKLIVKNLANADNEKYVMELLSRTGDLS